jgi:hypothetical protein
MDVSRESLPTARCAPLSHAAIVPTSEGMGDDGDETGRADCILLCASRLVTGRAEQEHALSRKTRSSTVPYLHSDRREASYSSCTSRVAETLCNDNGHHGGYRSARQFYAGSDEKTKLGERIENFAKRFIFVGAHPFAKRFAQALYFGRRNPLLHSFTLYDKTWKVSLTNRTQELVAMRPADPQHYVFGVEPLYAAFVGAIEVYRAEVVAKERERENFSKMFPLYGSIPVRHTVVERAPNDPRNQ